MTASFFVHFITKYYKTPKYENNCCQFQAISSNKLVATTQFLAHKLARVASADEPYERAPVSIRIDS